MSTDRLRRALRGLLPEGLEQGCDECGGDAGACPNDCAVRIGRETLAEVEPSHPLSSLPDWISYDEQRDVLTIHERDYAGILFREDGFLAPAGTLLRIVDNAGATITVERIPFDLLHHLHRQRHWSEQTFGPGERTEGVVNHIRKELIEVLAKPEDLSEWIDVVILALDGAWRIGATPEQIIEALVAKQTKNENRQWPDWRTAEPGKAIEHVRTNEISTKGAA